MNKGKKARVTNMKMNWHAFKIGSIVELIEKDFYSDKLFIFKGISKNDGKILEQSLHENDFEWVDEIEKGRKDVLIGNKYNDYNYKI